MPTYEYACDPCRVVYQTWHGMSAPPPPHCPKCRGGLRKLLSAPSLNTRNYSSPTQAKYANVSPSEELAREKELQKVYETIWLPPEVKHGP